jgi:hypothetical protein
MEYLISKNKFIEHWNRQRFSVDNMLPHFFSIFTNGCVDTVDVTTRKPCDSKTREWIYTGKSKTCCIKWQVLCDNLGHIIHVTGPFSSLEYDGHIWQDSVEELGLWNGTEEDNPEHSKRFEVFIGDNHYMNAPQCATPVNKQNKIRLDPMEVQYHNYCGSMRSTIEQVFGYLKTWAIIGGVYYTEVWLVEKLVINFYLQQYCFAVNYTMLASLFSATTNAISEFSEETLTVYPYARLLISLLRTLESD